MPLAKPEPPGQAADEPPKFLPDEPVKEKTGFELGDLAKAPAQPPELKAPRAVPTARQWRLAMVGLGVVLVGLLLWPLIGFWTMVAVAATGAILISLGVLVRL